MLGILRIIANPEFQFIDVTNPELALKILYSTNITYLLATKSDLTASQSKGYITSHLINFLPKTFPNSTIYQDSNVTIYQVPKLNPPSPESDLTLVIPGSSFDALANSNSSKPSNSAFYFPIDMLAESGLDYSIKIAETGHLLTANTLSCLQMTGIARK